MRLGGEESDHDVVTVWNKDIRLAVGASSWRPTMTSGISTGNEAILLAFSNSGGL